MIENCSRIITVFGTTKGGTGQSIFAVNLAIGLSKKINQPVALLDCSLRGINDLGNLLNLNSSKSLVDLLPLIDHLDAQLVRGYFGVHPSGVNLLQAVRDNQESKKLKPEHLEKIILCLTKSYPYVVIDTERIFSEFFLKIFDWSNLVFLLFTPDISTFNQTKYCLEKISELHYPLSLIKLVVNMYDLKNALPIEKLATLLGKEIFFQIPCDPETILLSINQANPAVLNSPRSPYAKAIFQLVGLLISQSDLYLNKRGQSNLEKEIISNINENTPNQNVLSSVDLVALKNKLHKNLLEKLDLKSLNLKTLEKQIEARERTKQILERLLAEEEVLVGSRDQRTELLNQMLDEVLGLGPLEPFLRDPSISEIMTIGKDKIYIERGGKIFLTGAKFSHEQQIMSIIERIVSPIGRRVDESMPLCDARLKDGSRVNIVIPPLALDGPMITIRKFAEKKLSLDDLIKFGALSPQMDEFLRICILLRKNIIVSGGTGSGKTTLLNILSSFIPSNERIVTIEDSAELKLQQEHIGRLESRPPNIEGGGEIPIRRLVINALRMRPDRIVIGECRGGEALDMLQAMNTGHDGSLTTVHANSPRDALTRLETMVLMSGMELPIRAIREQIKGAIDIIVQQARFSDGTRKITSITELTGMENEIITTQDIFRYRQTGIDENGKVIGRFEPTGIVPTFIEEIKVKGINFDLSNFTK